MHLVGNRQGRKVVRWGHVALNLLAFSAIAAIASAGIYLVVAKQWNPVILLVGPAVGLIATIGSLLVSLRTPSVSCPCSPGIRIDPGLLGSIALPSPLFGREIFR